MSCLAFITDAYASQVAQALEQARRAEARAEQLVSEVAAVRCGEQCRSLQSASHLGVMGCCAVSKRHVPSECCVFKHDILYGEVLQDSIPIQLLSFPYIRYYIITISLLLESSEICRVGYIATLHTGSRKMLTRRACNQRARARRAWAGKRSRASRRSRSSQRWPCRATRRCSRSWRK